TWCCGNNVCEGSSGTNMCEGPTGESSSNCDVDCPLFVDPNPLRTYYEKAPAPSGISSLAIGSGAGGHLVLYSGPDAVKTTDGGNYWTNVISDYFTPPPNQPQGTWSGRGDSN